MSRGDFPRAAVVRALRIAVRERAGTLTAFGHPRPAEQAERGAAAELADELGLLSLFLRENPEELLS